MHTPRISVVLRAVAAGLLLAARPLLAAEGNEGGWGLWLLTGRVFNLAVVVAVLVWVARKPLANFFASRTEAIRDQLAEAQKARIEAEAKLAEIESRMSRLDQELGELRTAAEREAQEEYRRLAAAAEAESGKIIERAKQEIDGMTREAFLELKAHAAGLAVGAAEQRIRAHITDEDRARLVDAFVAGLGEKK